MADISFTCTACGQSLEAPEEMAGEATACPACEHALVIPTQDSPAQADISPLQAAVNEAIVAEDEPVSDEKKCPNCGAGMQPDAILCVRCGFHEGLGKVIQTDLS